MPDKRRHRGAHPEDAKLFAAAVVPTLATATAELSWLLSHSYPIKAALALVGNRHALTERQRLAVQRCACTDRQVVDRNAKLVSDEQLQEAEVWIDGFNVVTTVEAALGGGVLLLARDGAMRDMASMHGSYRKVEETAPALAAIAELASARSVRRCHWLLDAPVSNSGRLKAAILEVARDRGLDWTAEVVADPDRLLRAATEVVVASADAEVLDAAQHIWHLARCVVAEHAARAWVVELGASTTD